MANYLLADYGAVVNMNPQFKYRRITPDGRIILTLRDGMNLRNVNVQIVTENRLREILDTPFETGGPAVEQNQAEDNADLHNETDAATTVNDGGETSNTNVDGGDNADTTENDPQPENDGEGEGDENDNDNENTEG